MNSFKKQLKKVNKNPLIELICKGTAFKTCSASPIPGMAWQCIALLFNIMALYDSLLPKKSKPKGQKAVV
jgi:hypothetical protein